MSVISGYLGEIGFWIVTQQAQFLSNNQQSKDIGNTLSVSLFYPKILLVWLPTPLTAPSLLTSRRCLHYELGTFMSTLALPYQEYVNNYCSISPSVQVKKVPFFPCFYSHLNFSYHWRVFGLWQPELASSIVFFFFILSAARGQVSQASLTFFTSFSFYYIL